jgi:hypothetical protein
VTSPRTKTAAAYRPRRAVLNWIDYLVIAATVMVFVGVMAINGTYAARAQGTSSVIPAKELPSQDAQPDNQLGMIKARIGLALAAR